jgi:HSF-type DNA-binding
MMSSGEEIGDLLDARTNVSQEQNPIVPTSSITSTAAHDTADDEESVQSTTPTTSSSTMVSTDLSYPEMTDLNIRPAKAAAIAAIALCSLAKSASTNRNEDTIGTFETVAVRRSSKAASNDSKEEEVCRDINIRLKLSPSGCENPRQSGRHSVKVATTAKTTATNPVTVDSSAVDPNQRHQQFLTKSIPRDSNGRFLKKTSKSTSSSSSQSVKSVATKMRKEAKRKTTNKTKAGSNISASTNNGAATKTGADIGRNTSVMAEEPLVLGHFDIGKNTIKRLLGQNKKSSTKNRSHCHLLSIVTYDYSEQSLRDLFLLPAAHEFSPGFGTRFWLLTHDMDRSHPDLLCWGLDGKSVIMCSDREYEDGGQTRMGQYLEKYFSHNKLKSLRRQLCYYGFDRHSNREEGGGGVYTHRRFKVRFGVGENECLTEKSG